MQNKFTSVVESHFHFLENEFNFVIVAAIPSPREDEWEGEVKYENITTCVTVSSSRGESPSLWIGRTKDNGEYFMPIEVIYEYMSLSDGEKRVVLNVAEKRQSRAILAAKSLSSLLSSSEGKQKELYFRVYASTLREHCVPFLRGDFSEWLAIWEYQVAKLTVEHIRAGRSELVPIIITDELGQAKVIGKKHVFQKSLDYINQLRTE